MRFDKIITSDEHGRDPHGARRAAAQGPVVITDGGRPSHVLLTVDEYRRLAGVGPSVADLLGGDPALADIDLDAVLPSRRLDASLRIPDFR